MEGPANDVCEVVTDKRPNGAGRNHEKEVLITRTSCNPSDDDCCLTWNDRHDRVEEGDDEDDCDEPIRARSIDEPSCELADDPVSRFGEDNKLHLSDGTGQRNL